ncbi:MAG: DUF6754 domain-containing protein [Bacillota bacterium]
MLRAGRSTMLILLLAYVIAIFYYVTTAKKGKSLGIRRVAGLDALDEAIGRATEMGRPIHYTMGLQDFEAQTFASFEILRYTAAQAAKRDVPLIVTNFRPAVHPVTEEIVRGAFMGEGKLESYKPDNVRYLSESQLAYATGVVGILERENVAANLMFGPFYAESLIFAETGQKVGAIQIAGTTMTAQLPFFVAVCDYTLIGEELFAAGGYLSKQPVLLGTLMAQDLSKMAALLLVIVGVIMRTAGNDWLFKLLAK